MLICKPRVNTTQSSRNDCVSEFPNKTRWCVWWWNVYLIWINVHTSAPKYLFLRKGTLLVRNTWTLTQSFFLTQSSPPGSWSSPGEGRCSPGLGNYCILLSQAPNFPAPGQGSIIPRLIVGCFSAVSCRTPHSALQTRVSFHKNLVLHIPVRVPGDVAMAISVSLRWRSAN